MEANDLSHGQTAQRSCHRIPIKATLENKQMREQMTEVVTGGNEFLKILTYINGNM